MKGGKADSNKSSLYEDKNTGQDKRRIKRRKMTPAQNQSLSAVHSEAETNWEHGLERGAEQLAQWYKWDWASEQVPAVLSPTYKQRNEDFRKLFKQLPDTERLIVDYSCALQRDILLQGRLYLSENWICFYSNIFRWETL